MDASAVIVCLVSFALMADPAGAPVTATAGAPVTVDPFAAPVPPPAAGIDSHLADQHEKARRLSLGLAF